MPNAFKERLHKGYAQSMELTGRPLVDEKSRFQRIKIFDTVANGRVMVLDDIVQITTRDESAYAEMLTHLPLLEHGRAERVMIVGGGDLSIAEEALKHKGVKEVVLVEIDEQVIARCRELFADINARAFKDKRLTIEVADAFEYLGRPQSKSRFDLIVADRPDPVGPGKALFGETFYERVKAALKPGGYATFQTGVPFYQPREIAEALEELARFFPQIGPLSHGRAELYRRLHGAQLGGQGQTPGNAGRHRPGEEGVRQGETQNRLLQSRHPRGLVRAPRMDRAAGTEEEVSGLPPPGDP